MLLSKYCKVAILRNNRDNTYPSVFFLHSRDLLAVSIFLCFFAFDLRCWNEYFHLVAASIYRSFKTCEHITFLATRAQVFPHHYTEYLLKKNPIDMQFNAATTLLFLHHFFKVLSIGGI